MISFIAECSISVALCQIGNNQPTSKCNILTPLSLSSVDALSLLSHIYTHWSDCIDKKLTVVKHH